MSINTLETELEVNKMWFTPQAYPKVSRVKTKEVGASIETPVKDDYDSNCDVFSKGR